MRVYIAASTPEKQYVKSYRSLHNLVVRDGDKVAEPEEFSRGDVTRIRFGNDFLEKTEYDAILLLDLDQKIPEDTLEKLREHDVDMVSGHYFKRGSKPVMSVCSVGEKWPYEPLFDIPTDGLHEIANTGFGCVLIKREVIEAVNELVGELEPIFALGPMPEVANGDYGTFGSDFRFFARARSLGYKLWLDASIECPHAATLWVTRKYYDIMRPYQMQEWFELWGKTFGFYGDYHEMDKQAAEVRLKQLQEARDQAATQAEQWTDKLKVIDGQIAERTMDLQERSDTEKRVPFFDSEEEVLEAIERGKNEGNDSGSDSK